MGSVKVDCYLSEYNVIPHECASMKILQSNCGYQRGPSEKKLPGTISNISLWSYTNEINDLLVESRIRLAYRHVPRWYEWPQIIVTASLGTFYMSTTRRCGHRCSAIVVLAVETDCGSCRCAAVFALFFVVVVDVDDDDDVDDGLRCRSNVFNGKEYYYHHYN